MKPVVKLSLGYINIKASINFGISRNSYHRALGRGVGGSYKCQGSISFSTKYNLFSLPNEFVNSMSNGTSFKCKTETETFRVFCHLSNPSYSPKLCKIGIVAIQSICQMSTHLLLSCLIFVHNLCLRCLEQGFEFEYLLAVFSSLIF